MLPTSASHSSNIGLEWFKQAISTSEQTHLHFISSSHPVHCGNLGRYHPHLYSRMVWEQFQELKGTSQRVTGRCGPIYPQKKVLQNCWKWAFVGLVPLTSQSTVLTELPCGWLLCQDDSDGWSGDGSVVGERVHGDHVSDQRWPRLYLDPVHDPAQMDRWRGGSSLCTTMVMACRPIRGLRSLANQRLTVSSWPWPPRRWGWPTPQLRKQPEVRILLGRYEECLQVFIRKK